MAFYLPDVTRVPGNDSGTYTTAVDKLLIHTTEGGSIEGAVAAYTANNSWPHVTVDARYGRAYRVVQHVPFDRPARALRNEAGGVETNRDGVIQFEVVGYATRAGEIDWAWLGANVFGPAARLMGVPVESSVTWVAYPASYGKGAAQRLTGAAWSAYRGFLGHQHVPENSHGDPGAIPIGTVLAAAGSTTTTTTTKGWDEMATKAEIQEVVRGEVGRAMAYLMANRTNAAYDENDPDMAWLSGAVTMPELLAHIDEHVDDQLLRAVMAVMGRNNALFDPAKHPWLNELPDLKTLDDKLDAITTELAGP